jgi:predicted small secreted protein
MRKWHWVLSVLAAMVLGAILTQWWYRPTQVQTTIEKQALLQQVEKVFKLVTVEGSFLEIYDYKDFYYYDWSPFRKKALVKVQATVSLGYDMEEVVIDVHEANRKVIIRNLPSVKILAMDIQPSFYDLQEGAFNSFSPKDHNKLMSDVRAMVETDTWESKLPEQAGEQLQDMLSLLTELLSAQGWSLEYNHFSSEEKTRSWARLLE